MKQMKIAAPTFLLREVCSQGRLFEVLEKEKVLGYDGVELVGFWDKSPEALRDQFRALDLVPMGNHVGYGELKADPDKLLRDHTVLGTPFMTVGGMPLPGTADFAEAAALINRLGPVFAAHGIRMLYHNHHFELERMADGKYVLDALMEAIAPEAMGLEADLGWMQIAGAEPLDFLERYRDRIPVVHFKDFYASDCGAIRYDSSIGDNPGGPEHADFAFRPLGYGCSNLPRLLPAVLAAEPDWLVVDHDCSYHRSPYHDLELSLDYLLNLLTDFG